jgi:TrmH family RNA methyltransferase
VHTCSDEVLRAMSEDAQGLLAVARMPQLEFADVDLSGIKNVAVLCQVRDPGNVGTIIRAADAAGADLVVLTSGSVDIFNPKVVRSTAGSLFHLPVVTDVDIDELARAFNAAHIQIFAAAGNADFDVDDLLDQVGAPSTQNADATDAGHVSSDGTPQAPDMTHPTAWLFGNEAQGLSEQEFAAADYTVSVPIRGAAESLNVATAATVCLYATSRAQR